MYSDTGIGSIRIAAIVSPLLLAGCSFQANYELAGGMSVVEETSVSGVVTCRIYARNRTVEEIVQLIRPKLEHDLIVDGSVDTSRKVDEVEIEASDWPTLLQQLSSALNLTVTEEEGSLKLAAQ